MCKRKGSIQRVEYWLIYMEESYSRQRIRWKRCTVQQRDNTRQERAARTLGCFFSS